MSRWAASVLSILVLAALLATPANAEQLSFSDEPLEGSSFQGADGNQDPTATWRDWESLQAGRGVRHLPDANDPDSAFVGGTKVLKPGEWRLTEERDGVDPAKANILDGWTAVRQPRGHTFLYLGFTREEEGGTTSITFELNHDGELWRNPAGAMVPCRQDGDLLVSFQQLGNRFVVLVSSWETTTPATDGRQCALAGRLRLLRDADFPASAVQGWLNTGPIINRLRGGFYDVGDELQAGVFGEAAVDLTELLQAAMGDRCASFASIWMHSRASEEEQSQMQDYVAPQPLAVRTCSASGTKFFDLNANGARETGEPGLPRFMMWADYSPFNGVHDVNEPFAVTDSNGRYVINDIKPGGDGTYMLRETLLTSRRRLRAVANEWVCSYPFSTGPNGRFACAWPPINVNTTHYARGRAFGNWYPAQVTVEKDLFPPDDPGEFELRVGRLPRSQLPAGGVERDHLRSAG